MKQSDKCIPCYHVAGAYYGKTFEWLVKQAAASVSFRKEWDSAMSKYMELIAENPAAFAEHFKTVADVRLGMRAGMRLECYYWFLRLAEFIGRFKYTPEVLGVKTFVIKDEQGIKDLRGVLIRPTADEPLHLYRVVSFFSETAWGVDELMYDGRTRLRGQQPTETFDAISNKKAKSHKMD